MNILLWILQIILGILIIWWVITWGINGGFPLSGPVNDTLPPHVEFVTPTDGEAELEVYGFCVHFNYQAGNGIGDEPETAIRYYLDGFNVTGEVVDIARTEYGYPDPIGEPCYRREKSLSSGWHTAKVTYEDSGGDSYSYTWRFFIAGLE